ncbi:MAG: histidine kinase [Rhodospirillales bacterium CG15_BIG_FIL_POST_REV_8_21_14_020_66_15]|nr:MAG: histidine kinase [Rhodospirillales bacterium CG15_BIG_FIL_POST_REV_8_21_14_020_66_15]
MNVKHILERKGSAVTTIKPGATIAEAARMLTEARIGAVVVSEDGATINGILSERDIVRVIGTDGPSALTRPVTTAMTANVITCKPDDRINILMGMMTQRRIRHLPVAENGRMTGLISIGDVVKERMDEIEADATAMRDYITGMTA